VLLIGRTGVGKTFIAQTLGLQACARDAPRIRLRPTLQRVDQRADEAEATSNADFRGRKRHGT